MMIEAVDALEKRKDTATAFRLFREARRAWEEVRMTLDIANKFHKAAKTAFQKNPRDHDALFVIIVHESSEPSCNYAELASMAKTCVSLNPGIPDYHFLLGRMLGKAENHHDALGSFERALELERVPDWLYNRATCLRLLERGEREVIKAYEDYVRASEKDAGKVPEANCYIGLMYTKLGDAAQAKKYWETAREAESHRLPCFGPVLDDFLPKVELAAFVQMSEVAARRGRLAKPNQSRTLAGERPEMRCGNCGDQAGGNLSTCSSCKNVRYCGRECQRQHWPVHKKACKK